MGISSARPDSFLSTTVPRMFYCRGMFLKTGVLVLCVSHTVLQMLGHLRSRSVPSCSIFACFPAAKLTTLMRTITRSIIRVAKAQIMQLLVQLGVQDRKISNLRTFLRRLPTKPYWWFRRGRKDSNMISLTSGERGSWAMKEKREIPYKKCYFDLNGRRRLAQSGPKRKVPSQKPRSLLGSKATLQGNPVMHIAVQTVQAVVPRRKRFGMEV